MQKYNIKSLFLFGRNKVKNGPLYWRTFLILLFLLFFVKIFVIYTSYKNLNPLENCISNISWDILLLLFAQIIVFINFHLTNKKFRLMNDVILFIILVLFIIDIFAIHYFQGRVTISWAFMFASTQRWSFTRIWLLWLVFIIILSLIAFWWIHKVDKNAEKSAKWTLIILSVSLMIYSIFYVLVSASRFSNKYTDNILMLNFKTLFNSEKSYYWDNENITVEESYPDYFVQTKWEGKKLNVILVFAESLSAIDSQNVWWNNQLPNFDKIQNDWITFTNFVTNGRTSDTAHVSTLLWFIPLINLKEYTGYRLVNESLPEFFNNQWYQTTFISSVTLDFLNQRDFLSWAWFQKIIWEEEFQDYKKYTFDAAPDEILFDRTLEEVKNQTGNFFINLQTISFHTPYNTPYWNTEEDALRYADESLYNFYSALKDLWYFDSWILVIVGDHRKILPAEEGEYELYWEGWNTKSVATVVWSGIRPGTKNDNLIQHSDFYNSIKKLIWNGDVSIDKTYNDIFTNKVWRIWWITSAKYASDYIVSYADWSSFIFNSISTLKLKDSEIYKYFSSFFDYELKNEDEENLDNQIVLVWHRWSPNTSPDNTLEWFINAKREWAKWIEFDVSYTKDKNNIVAHWDYFHSSNCKDKKVFDYDLQRIQENCILNNWEWYKTLEDMLSLVDGLFDYYFLEIKVSNESDWEQQALEIIQTVKDLNMQDRVIFISYSESARKVLNSNPDIIFWRDTFNIPDLDFVGENNSKYFLAPYNLLTPEIVQRVRWLWKIPVTYTVNTTWDYQKVKDLWINIIMTDKISDIRKYDNSIL